MKVFSAFLMAGVISTSSFALEALNDEDLKKIEGQAGADLSLKLSLNHKVVDGKYVFDNAAGGICQNVEYCRLAVAVNNRYLDTGGQPSSQGGYKLWLVMKGIQGTVNVQKIGLDGVDLTYKNDSGADKIKAAMQLSFDRNLPIQIRNFGFDAISFGQDKFVTNATTDGDSTNPADYGYLQVSRYDSTNAPKSAYDHGREKGFMGLQINGNLAVQGKVMMFGCDASHPRC